MTAEHPGSAVLPTPSAGTAVTSGDGQGFNLSSWTLRHKALVTFLLALITLFGVLSYNSLAQSEDPPFTF